MEGDGDRKELRQREKLPREAVRRFGTVRELSLCSFVLLLVGSLGVLERIGQAVKTKRFSETFVCCCALEESVAYADKQHTPFSCYSMQVVGSPSRMLAMT